ncbi:MAG: sugar phosphate isomerase/epimerase [Candidatus Hydrogenedentes bacterium]|nr:sugar phosphate isomerase/epimerase [Candidatus Hydrogenedentota bacterium]
MKFSICSEIFKEWDDIERTIAYVKQIGYDGIEIAPFTLAQYVTDISPDTRRAIAAKAGEVGLDVVGLHWILVGPDGLYLNHPDAEVRDRTAQYLRDLAQCCADVGGDIMIFGSPKQRNVMEGLSYDQAFDYAVETFQAALPACADLGITICMEPLTHLETNFCQSAEETMNLVKAVGHPNFGFMLDTKAMTFEQESRADLIRKYGDSLRHYHANDENLNGPGWGDVDFGPIFEALNDVGFDGYVSVEVFEFEPGPEAIAEKSLAYMKQFA